MLVKKKSRPEGKKQLGKSEPRWGKNIKMGVLTF